MKTNLNEGVLVQFDKHNPKFSKKDKKNHSSTELESKDKTYDIPRHSLWERTKAAARKTFLGGATAAQMAAPTAAPAATTVVIPTAVLMAALQSCVEQNVDIDMSPILEKLDKLITLIGTNNDALLAELQKIRNEVQSGNMQNQELGNAILAALDRSDARYQEIIDLITELNAEVQKGNMTSEVMLDKILKELQSINTTLGKLDELKEVIENMDKNNQESNKLLAEKIEEMISKYEQGGLSMEELMNQVIALIGTSNNISSDILEKVQELYEKYENGGLSESELLQEIINQLGGINDKLDQIYAQMQQDSENFNQYVEGNQANWEKLFANMDNLFNGIGDINSKLDAIKTNGDISNEYLQKISEAADAAIKALAEIKSEIGQTNVSIGDLIEKMEANGQKDYEPILKEMLEKLGLLDEINNKQFTIDQLQEALKGYKTDLSTTNELIQTAISLLEQIAGGGIGTGDMSTVNQLLSQLYEAVVSGNSNIDTLLKDLIAKAQEIAEDTGNINDKLDQIISKMDTQIDLLTTTQNAVSSYAEQILSELKKTNADLDDIKNYSTKLDTYLDKQDTYLSKAVDYLAQLVENQGGNTSYEELLAAVQAGNGTLSNIESLLNDLNIKAGDFVTNETLNQALEANKTNLTTTNELIQTAISLLEKVAGNSGIGGGSVNTTRMEELLGQILSQLANNHQATSSDLEDLKTAIQEVESAIKAQGSTAMKSSTKAGEFLKNYLAYSKMANAENARKYDDSTYYWRS